jgi:peroxiredoxin
MSRQTIGGKGLGILINGGVFIAVALFALVENQSALPQYRAGASLEDIVQSAKTWDVSFTPWFGSQAPDFTLEDTEGKRHTLSDYHGRDVLVVFWAAWCPACNAEIPHLIELRKAFSEDELAILAISAEPPAYLRRFAAARAINYPIASLGGARLPAPFGSVALVPTTFFIDRHGVIKLATVGPVPFEEAKAILQAQR